jgi:hypothetical protein
MTTSRSEDLLVGIIALAVVPWSLWIIRRGLRDGRLPIGRGYVRREERPTPFNVLLLLYAAAAAGALYISLDLLFGMGARGAR